MKSKKCILCGICITSCPIYRVLRNEKVSPRGKAIMISNDLLDKMIYACTLCGACKKNCLVDFDLKLRKVRERLVKEGIETTANKKMIENIRKHGNPYGKLKEGEKPEELYCC